MLVPKRGWNPAGFHHQNNRESESESESKSESEGEGEGEIESWPRARVRERERAKETADGSLWQRHFDARLFASV